MTKPSSSASPGPWRWDYDGLRGGPLDRPIAEAVYDRERDMRIRVNNEADANLIASAPEMAEMLRELEHAPTDGICPMCGNGREDEHAPGCRLSALLKRLP